MQKDNSTKLSESGRIQQMIRIVTKIGHCRHRKWPIHVETINGEDASSSPYANALKINIDASPDFNHLVLYQKHMQAGRA